MDFVTNNKNAKVSSRSGRVTRSGLLAVLLIALYSVSALALDYGKIKGVVTDKETKQPIIGATVAVVGTDLGAITDVDGSYQIRLVPPGDYTLEITYLGKETITVKEVRVFSDLTTEQNAEMQESSTELEGVTITAQKDIIDKFETSNTTKLEKEAIQRKPVTTVDDMLKTVSGVTTSNEGQVFIRGGRAGEVAYYVDGVNTRDPVGGPGPVSGGVSLVAGSVQEIQVIKDGFDPEYGNALSGVIKITSQTGSPNHTALNLRYITDDFGTKDLNKYSRNYDNIRFTLSGPDPILTSKLLPALGIDFLKDKELTYFMYFEGQTEDGSYNYFNYLDGNHGNRGLDGYNFFGINVPERLDNSYNMNTNLAFKPRPDMKFIASYQASFERITSFGWAYLYTPGTAPMNERTWNLGSLKMTHSLSPNFNYEVILSYKRNDVEFGPGDPAHPGKIMKPDQFLQQPFWESFTDINGDGVYTEPEPIINTLPDTVGYGLGLSGPGYTFGEIGGYTDIQSGRFIGNPAINALIGTYQVRDFRFNQYGLPDPGGNPFILADELEGEVFADLNGNGVWDAGDPFRDTNGNGRYDDARKDIVNEDKPEPYTDGDISLGEPFTDVNGNGVYDPGIDVFLISIGPENQDLNRNSRYDGPNPFLWSVGVPYIDINGNGVFDLPNGVYDQGEQFVDLNGNGKYDGANNFFDLGSYDTETQWHQHTVETVGGEIKLNGTIDNHELKGGFEIHTDDFNHQDIRRLYQPYSGRPDGGPYPGVGSSRDFFGYKPTMGALYFQDKLEYGSMIAALGFRWDFFVQSDGLLEVALNDDLNTGVIYGDRHKFSPRIGFSYPISDKAKVYFNYGHFYQLPTFDYIYGRNTSAADFNDVVGNYNLDYEKTIQYSFGVQYKLSDQYHLKVGGYYKDEFDKVSQQDVRLGAIRVRQYQNSDYGRSRGFEMELGKRGGIVNGEVSYTYAFAYGKASQTNRNFLDDFAISRQSLAERPLDVDIRHSLKTALQLVVPKNQDASLFGIPILNDWTLAIEGVFESGRPFTPGRDYPGLILPAGQTAADGNSLRQPSRLYFDARFEKNFGLAGLNYTAILWVENVFDNKFARSVYGDTGLPYTSSVQSGVIFGGSESDRNPLYYDAGREIRVGIQMNL